MAYNQTKSCIYCGIYFNVIRGSKYALGASQTLINGHPEGSKEALASLLWCGKCDKSAQDLSPVIDEILRTKKN